MGKTIHILYFEAASGHLSAARALEKALKITQPDIIIELVNVVDLFQHHGLFQKIVKSGIAYFNYLLTREILSDLPGLIRLSIFVQSTVGKEGFKKIAAFWKTNTPDSVVSVTPMYNEVMYYSLMEANPKAQYFTIPVDFAEPRSRYWFTPKIKNIVYLNAKEELMKQAETVGIEKSKTHKIGGMLVDTDCYEATENEDKSEALIALGLNPEWPVITVTYGGQGSVIVKKIAQQIEAYTAEINVIFLCGKNQSVFDTLSSETHTFRKCVLGYQEKTPIHFIRLSDVVIGKPGAITITENLILEKPALYIKSTGLHFVQACNEQWVEEKKVGIVVKKITDIPQALSQLLTDKTYIDRIKKEHHQGVFDAAKKIVDLCYIESNN